MRQISGLQKQQEDKIKLKTNKNRFDKPRFIRYTSLAGDVTFDLIFDLGVKDGESIEE